MPSTSAAKPAYRLADHVRACRIDNQVILLDLRRNKYLGLDGRHLSALSRAIEDWPCAAESATDHGDNTKLIAPLIGQGMLAPFQGALPARPLLEDPLQSLSAENESESSSFEWTQLLSLWTSAAVTSHWLRRRTLADIAAHVAGRRNAAPASTRPPGDLIASAVATYMRVRPFAFTAHDRCLHDSLTLTRFLAARGLFPRWVIGVKTSPFGAHSWVQSGQLVLNDLHENVRRYRPILVV